MFETGQRLVVALLIVVANAPFEIDIVVIRLNIACGAIGLLRLIVLAQVIITVGEVQPSFSRVGFIV